MSIAPEQFMFYLSGERTIAEPRGGTGRTAVKTIGELRISSGALVACDPALPEPLPMAERFPIGIFPVEVVIVTFEPQQSLLRRVAGGLIPLPQPDRRIALAVIRFSTEPVARWQPATALSATGGEQAAPYVYGVDSATGCFMDLLAAERAAATDGELFAHVIIDGESAADEPTWLTMSFRATPHLNIVAFNSGWGDGAYTTYIGSTEQGAVVRVVTDFKVL
jgi:hypothetical protein